jgi:hypothetical protein
MKLRPYLLAIAYGSDLPSRNNWAVGNFSGSRFDLCFVRGIASRPGLVLTASDTALRIERYTVPMPVCKDAVGIIVTYSSDEKHFLRYSRQLGEERQQKAVEEEKEARKI